MESTPLEHIDNVDDGENDPIGANDDAELGPNGEPMYDAIPGDFIAIPEVSIEEIVQTKISKNIRELQDFLATGNMSTEKGDQKTNLINVSEKKTYCLTDDRFEEFFTILDECRKENRMLHFSERQETSETSHTGIMIDFDRYQRSKTSEFTSRHFGILCSSIMEIIFNIIDTSHLPLKLVSHYRVFVIKKPCPVMQPRPNGASPTDPPIYKDGFHILIPEIQVTKGVKRYLLDEMNRLGVVNAAFRDLDHIEDASKMLDMMSASVPVHFFGNSKPGKPSYKIEISFDFTRTEADRVLDRQGLSIDTYIKGVHDGKPINLTYELSLGYYTKTFCGAPSWLEKIQYKCKQELETKIQLVVEKKNGGIIPDDDLIAAENSVDVLTVGNAEAKYIKNLLSIIDLSYAVEYEKWFKVICALAHTNTNYKPLAVWFSQRAPEKWSPIDIDRVWTEACNARGVRAPLTKRSIIHWAKESSPARFREIEKENYIEILSRYVYSNDGRVEHAMVGRIVHAMISDKFVVDVGPKDSGRSGYVWYEYVMQGQQMRKGEIFKWRREADPDNVHLFISEHLPKIYAEQAQRIKDRKENAVAPEEAKYWALVEKTFKLYMSKLSNDGFQTGVVRQAQYRFRVRGFIEELDTYEDVIGVGNGVLKTGIEPRLIRGFHEYKISKYTEVDYVPINFDCKYVQGILEMSRGIFPEPDVNLFMWLHASTGVSMHEAACILLLIVGGGQNGKSSWVKMIHNTLGNMYAAAGKATLLVSKMERGEGANSAQMQMRGKTFVYMDEFERSTTLNDARVKSVVNPGWQSGRDLHEKQTNFKNTCNPVGLSNYEFGVTTTDHGMWRRLYYYKAKMKFCKNPTPGNKYERKGDPAWEVKNPSDPNYKQAMLSLLVHYNQILWREYDGDLKNVPVPTIRAETEEWRNRQDMLNRFITRCVVRSPDCDVTALQTIAERYSAWYAKNIKPGVFTLQEAECDIENSRIGQYLEYRMAAGKFLVGHRIRGETELLGEGEQLLIDYDRERDGIKAENVVEDAPLPKVVGWKRPVEDGANPIQDLVRGGPKHIQNTKDQRPHETTIGELGGILDEITTGL